MLTFLPGGITLGAAASLILLVCGSGLTSLPNQVKHSNNRAANQRACFSHISSIIECDRSKSTRRRVYIFTRAAPDTSNMLHARSSAAGIALISCKKVMQLEGCEPAISCLPSTNTSIPPNREKIVIPADAEMLRKNNRRVVTFCYLIPPLYKSEHGFPNSWKMKMLSVMSSSATGT